MTVRLPPWTTLGEPGEVVAYGPADPPLEVTKNGAGAGDYEAEYGRMTGWCPRCEGKGCAECDTAEKVGKEGYIHGFICVEPPCGVKPGKISYADLKVRKDGTVVHRASGLAIGHVEKNPDGTYTAHHVDGTVTTQHGQGDSLMAIVSHYNSSSSPKLSTPEPAPRPAARGLHGAALWKTDAGTVKYTPQEAKSIARIWYNNDFGDVENYLRNPGKDLYWRGHLASPAEQKQVDQDIAAFKAAISRAKPFSQDTELARGVDGPDKLFGPVGSHIGTVFTDKGFVSTTSNVDLAKGYSPGTDTARVIVHAPAGTRALKVDPEVWGLADKKAGQATPDVLQEYTFPPGTQFKILSDHVVQGYRVMQVEVQP